MNRNPARGCGTKSTDSFYLEGPEIGIGGGLWAWTWLLSDGVGNAIYANIPARQVLEVNPAGTIFAKQLILASPQYMALTETAESVDLWARLQGATRLIGIGDHVGKDNYSPFSFAEEVAQYGPSRKVSKEVAKTIAGVIQNHGPIPMLYTHDRMPVFYSEEQRSAAFIVAEGVLSEDLVDRDYHDDAVWDHDDWGQYARLNQYSGSNSYLRIILSVTDQLDRNWAAHKDNVLWKEVRAFFGQVRFTEQPFGLSWMTRVTYTLPKEGKGKAGEEVRDEIPGVDILDLDNL